jgi:hypothetical protein
MVMLLALHADAADELTNMPDNWTFLATYRVTLSAHDGSALVKIKPDTKTRRPGANFEAGSGGTPGDIG